MIVMSTVEVCARLASRACAAKARRSASGRARNAACQAGSRTCLRNARYAASSVHNTSPCRISVGVPYRSTTVASSRMSMPQRRAYSLPSRKSRLPAMKCTGTPALATLCKAVDARVQHRVVIVSDIGLEQVAQDVKCVGAARLAGTEALEILDDVRARVVEVQVGDEQRVRTQCPPPGLFFFVAGVEAGACPVTGDSGSAVGCAASPISFALWITTSGRGTSPMNGPCGPVGRLSILSTTSMPFTTFPNTA